MLFNRLEKLQKESDCSSVGEVSRKILSQKKINCFYKDISLNAPMDDMALIIGINMNQQTKYFHTSQSSAERAFYVMETADLYKKVDERIDRLLIIISN
jgi:hypothetical protein